MLVLEMTEQCVLNKNLLFNLQETDSSCLPYIIFVNPFGAIPKNGQTHSNKSSAICRRFV